jgi:hypothetical protein
MDSRERHSGKESSTGRGSSPGGRLVIRLEENHLFGKKIHNNTIF